MELHSLFASGVLGQDALFALSELSFSHAEKTNDSTYYMQAAIYAYAFLFPEDPDSDPDQYDPRLRLACELYNRGLLTSYLGGDVKKSYNENSKNGSQENLTVREVKLPIGTLEIHFDRRQLTWGDRHFTHFEPVSELQTRGLRTNYRFPGIGAPFAASTEPISAEENLDRYLSRALKVPVVLFFRFENLHEQLIRGEIETTAELHVVYDNDSVQIGKRIVPLELEPSASLVYMLSESRFWEFELKHFFSGGVLGGEPSLTMLSPHKKGRIPIVLVHGTASSSARWAELVNDLSVDPELRKHFQIWLFTYNTGNPVSYSAAELREEIRKAVDYLDPEGKDPALREMVVIGHSQGGLLTKMTSISSGTQLWDRVATVPLDEMDLSDESREILQRNFFVEPVPEVKRVVFISTPHRGSFISDRRLGRWISTLVKMPRDITELGVDVITRNPEHLAFTSVESVPSSVDNMRTNSPFLEELVSIPVAPDVASHSIIPVKGDGPYEEGDDGVVTYKSAHLEDVDSELVIQPAHHSCQSHPYAIREVRRILLLHLAERREAQAQ
ncbi:MAG: alpha/beta fold hydrolase [Deltaproteobacteria bacterium]|nr:alpha/beta fold hydrolase [Deltaproteobacteria bacterium]